MRIVQKHSIDQRVFRNIYAHTAMSDSFHAPATAATRPSSEPPISTIISRALTPVHEITCVIAQDAGKAS